MSSLRARSEVTLAIVSMDVTLIDHALGNFHVQVRRFGRQLSSVLIIDLNLRNLLTVIVILLTDLGALLRRELELKPQLLVLPFGEDLFQVSNILLLLLPNVTLSEQKFTVAIDLALMLIKNKLIISQYHAVILTAFDNRIKQLLNGCTESGFHLKPIDLRVQNV